MTSTEVTYGDLNKTARWYIETVNLLKFQVNLTRLPLRPVISLGKGKSQGTIPDRIPLHGREQSPTQSPQAPWSAVWSPGEVVTSYTRVHYNRVQGTL